MACVNDSVIKCFEKIPSSEYKFWKNSTIYVFHFNLSKTHKQSLLNLYQNSNFSIQIQDFCKSIVVETHSFYIKLQRLIISSKKTGDQTVIEPTITKITVENMINYPNAQTKIIIDLFIGI